MSKSPMVSEKGLIKSRAQGYLGLSQGGRFLRGAFADLQPTSNGQRQDDENNGTAGVEKGDFDHAVGAYPSIKGTLEAFSRKRLEVTRHIISSSWTKKATATMV